MTHDRGTAGPASNPFRSLRSAILFLILLAPAFLLHSTFVVLRHELGFRDARTILAFALIYALPVAIGWPLASASPDAVRRRLAGSLLALGSTLATLAAAEAAVRLAGAGVSGTKPWRKLLGEEPFVPAGSDRMPHRMKPLGRWGHEYSSDERGYFGDGRSVHYGINAAGYRGREFTVERVPATARVAVLGDSFAFGQGVKDGDVFAALLEKSLPACPGSGVEVYNFSVPAYATIHEAALLESDVLAYRPDLVVVWYFLNDTETIGTLHFFERTESPSFFPLARRFSALARLAGARLDVALMTREMIRHYRASYDDADPRWLRVKGSLQRISDLSRSSGTPVVSFVHPILFRLGESYPFADLHSKVLAAAREAGLPAHDLTDAFEGMDSGTLWVHPSDQHPNEIAHRLAAEYAAPQVAALLPPCR